MHLHFPGKKNSAYCGQRKHLSPQSWKDNKFQEGKKCIFLDPPARCQEET